MSAVERDEHNTCNVGIDANVCNRGGIAGTADIREGRRTLEMLRLESVINP